MFTIATHVFSRGRFEAKELRTRRKTEVFRPCCLCYNCYVVDRYTSRAYWSTLFKKNACASWNHRHQGLRKKYRCLCIRCSLDRTSLDKTSLDFRNREAVSFVPHGWCSFDTLGNDGCSGRYNLSGLFESKPVSVDSGYREIRFLKWIERHFRGDSRKHCSSIENRGACWFVLEPLTKCESI